MRENAITSVHEVITLRRVSALAIGTAFALALAAPGRASGTPIPPAPAPLPIEVEAPVPDTAPPPPPVVPVHELPALPSPDQPDQPVSDEPPVVVTVTDDEPGNLDVSVRVLSPEESEAESQENGDAGVISDVTDGGITPTPDVSEPSVDSEPIPPTPAGTNVNVSIRVLSPGEDGAVDQSTSSELEEPTTGDSSGSPDVAPGTESEGDSDPSSEQYHDEDSQYQDAKNSDEDPWSWVWYLALDCDGNVISESAETGSQSSLDWTWDWEWEWECGSPDRPPPIGELDPGSDVSSSTASPSPTAGDENASADASAAAGEPWLWTWTFTFCGETVTAPMTIDHASPLEWIWDWTWSWTCEAPATAPTEGESPFTPPAPLPPAPVVEAPPTEAPSPDTSSSAPDLAGADPLGILLLFPPLPAISIVFPAIPLDFPSLSSLPIVPVEPLLESFPEVGSAGIPVLLDLPGPATAQPAIPLPALPSVSVTVIVTLPTALAPTSASPWPTPEPASRAAERRGRARPVGAPILVLPGNVQTDAAAETVRPTNAAPKHTATRQSRRDADPLPLPRPFQAAGAAGATGGGAPGGVVAGTAALIGFLVLSAPGLGRRIRAARGLRPRGRHGSSIDRPG